MKPRAALAACLLLATAVGFLSAADPLLKERIWTDQQGRKMRGRFERLENGNIVLNSGGTLTTVPLSQLSDADQAFLDNPNPAPAATRTAQPAPAVSEPPMVSAAPRNWSINGRQVVGGIKSADERGLILATAAGDFRLGYEVLTDDVDLLETSRYLASTGRSDLAQKLQDTFEKNSGRAFPLPPMKDNTAKPADEDPLPADDEKPVNESPDKVLEVDVPLPTRERPDYRTADKLLNKADQSPNKNAQAEEEERFQRTVIWGGLTLFVAVGAIITYGWWASRK